MLANSISVGTCFPLVFLFVRINKPWCSFSGKPTIERNISVSPTNAFILDAPYLCRGVPPSFTNPLTQTKKSSYVVGGLPNRIQLLSEFTEVMYVFLLYLTIIIRDITGSVNAHKMALHNLYKTNKKTSMDLYLRGVT
jgi:hypothetical protein